MTTITDSRHHTRELIRSFARIDECFDVSGIDASSDHFVELSLLNNKLEFLLSFPVEETKASLSTRSKLTVSELERIDEILPVAPGHPGAGTLMLRETLRDRLYEFLLRMDHCSNEQLATRCITLPPSIRLSLMHLNQIVVHLITGCIRNLNKLDESDTMDGINR
jgi:hypothetical protein